MILTLVLVLWRKEVLVADAAKRAIGTRGIDQSTGLARWQNPMDEGARRNVLEPDLPERYEQRATFLRSTSTEAASGTPGLGFGWIGRRTSLVVVRHPRHLTPSCSTRARPVAGSLQLATLEQIGSRERVVGASRRIIDVPPRVEAKPKSVPMLNPLKTSPGAGGAPTRSAEEGYGTIVPNLPEGDPVWIEIGDARTRGPREPLGWNAGNVLGLELNASGAGLNFSAQLGFIYDADCGPGITFNVGNGSSITWGDKSGNNLLPDPIQTSATIGISNQVYWVPYDQYFNSTAYSADAQAGSAVLHGRAFVDDNGLNGVGAYLARVEQVQAGA